MSLMNEALRKKNRETTGSPAPTGFIDVSQRPRISRQWLVGLAAMMLLTAAAFYGTHLVQTSTAPPLLVKSPSPGHTRPPAQRSSLSASDAHDQSDTTPLPASVRRQTEAFTSEEPPTGDRMAAAGLEPASPSLAESRNVPGTHDGMSASKLPSADAQPVFPLVTTVSGSDETPVQSTPRETDAVSRAVEPGPLQKPNTGGKTRSLTPRHPPSPAQLAPPTAPVASKPTGGRNTDAAVRKTVPSDGDDDLFYKKARVYHRSNRLDDAIGLYRRVLNTDSNHPGAMLNLAAAYMQQGNFVAAHPLLKRLERSSPRPQGVLLNLAIASIGMGAHERALADLERAAAQSDASPWEIRFHRAVVFARMNRLPEALVLYRDAARERPDDPRLQFNLAVTCDALGLYPEAIAHYKAVLQAPALPSETDEATIISRIRTIGRYLAATQSATKGQ